MVILNNILFLFISFFLIVSRQNDFHDCMYSTENKTKENLRGEICLIVERIVETFLAFKIYIFFSLEV